MDNFDLDNLESGTWDNYSTDESAWEPLCLILSVWKWMVLSLSITDPSKERSEIDFNKCSGFCCLGDVNGRQAKGVLLLSLSPLCLSS